MAKSHRSHRRSGPLAACVGAFWSPGSWWGADALGIRTAASVDLGDFPQRPPELARDASPTAPPPSQCLKRPGQRWWAVCPAAHVAGRAVQLLAPRPSPLPSNQSPGKAPGPAPPTPSPRWLSSSSGHSELEGEGVRQGGAGRRDGGAQLLKVCPRTEAGRGPKVGASGWAGRSGTFLIARADALTCLFRQATGRRYLAIYWPEAVPPRPPLLRGLFHLQAARQRFF